MGDIDTTSNSNSILLSGRQWIGLGIFTVALYVGVPALWKRSEPFEPKPDHRIPYTLGNDAWQYRRWAGEPSEVAVLGDSVVWGQFVKPDGTLTAALNRRAGRPRFANLGLDGAHPAALTGLLTHHTPGLDGRTVLLHCNLLWMSSARHDLTGEEEFAFNHPALVPQFVPSIPCYGATLSERIGVEVGRRVPFQLWTKHLQAAYFEGDDIHTWSLDHPYENPLARITRRLPAPEEEPLRHEAIPWTERGIKPQPFEWVAPEESFQWKMFRRAVEILRGRGCTVRVLVGPFNEHMIAPEGRAGYDRLKAAVEAWLTAEGIPYDAPPPLPSELYGDASHPLTEGYERLAALLKW